MYTPPVDPAKPIRKRLVRHEEPGARFITFSCQRRLPLLAKPAIADLFSACLVRARERWKFKLFAWVVMPEHVHLLVRPPDGTPLDRILLSLKLAVSERVIARWRELDAPILRTVDDGRGNPRFWQKGGGFDRNVRDDAEFGREVQYIHRNPVERGLVKTPEEWRWSSVRWWMGARENEVGCDPAPGRGWDGWKGFK